METHDMVIQEPKRGEVTFVCNAPATAKAVCLAGNFNAWNPTAARMIRTRDGSFRAKFKLDPGEYPYKFVVDGQWVNDPDAENQVANPYGTLDSVIRIR